MKDSELERLFRRWRAEGEVDALAELFDRLAPGLRRLARRLGARPAEADDLVQETFLTALERPESYDETRPLLPWLCGILAHRAREARRREARRVELGGHEGEERGEASAALEARELRAELERAIAELPPSLRAVVEGRVLAETPHRALAEELALAPGALRTRLYRGLERLRRALPPGLATLVALTFLQGRGLARARERVLERAARRTAAKGAAAHAVTLGAGWILMSKSLVIVTGVALAALLVWKLSEPGGASSGSVAPQPARVQAPPPEPRREGPSRAPSATRQALAELDGAELAAPPAAAELVVRVRDDRSGAPVDGAELSVTLERDGEPLPLEAATGPDGAARFTLAAGDELARVDVAPGETTPPAREWLRRTVAAGERVELDLALPEAFALSGRVVDAAGLPVPGAEVLGWCGRDMKGAPHRRAQAGADGAFRIAHLGPQFVLTARAPGLACAVGLRGDLQADVAGSAAAPLELRLAPAATLIGRVLLPNGAPAEGAQVTARSGLSSTSSRDATAVPGVTRFQPATRGEARTDARGRFEIAGLTAGRQRVNAELAPYIVASVSLEVGAREQTIELDAGLSLRGQVLEPSGRPAAGAELRFWPFWGNRQTVPHGMRADEAGFFELRGMNREGPHALGIVHAGCALQIVQPVEPGPDGGRHVRVVLEPERVIAGVVLDSAGRPAAGVKVSVEGERETDEDTDFGRRRTWEWRLGHDEARTDAAGRFRFDKLYDGEFLVRAFSPLDDALSVEVRAEAGDEDVELVLDAEAMRGVAFTGRVTDAATGAPVERFTVVPMVGSRGSHHEFEDAEGRYEVVGLPEEPIELMFVAPGYAEHRLEVERAAGTHTIDVELAPERSLLLRVVDEAGAPHRNGRVRVRDLAGETVWVRTGYGSSTSLHVSGGEAWLHGLPAAPLTLEVEVDGALPERVEVDLRRAASGPLEVVIAREARVSLELLVLDLGGAAPDAELERRLASAEDPESRDWLMAQVALDGLGRLRGEARGVLTSEPEGAVAGFELVPEGDGYRMATELRSGAHSGSGQSGEIPYPIAPLRLPTRLWSVRVELADGRVAERALDLRGAAEGERRFEVLVVRGG